MKKNKTGKHKGKLTPNAVLNEVGGAVKLEDVIEKYFKDSMKYFHSSDAHKNIEGDTYLTYKWDGKRIELYFGGDNGEVCLCVTENPDKIDKLINAIIYG